MEFPGAVLTFIVRITAHDAGQLAGTVERVRTGEKHRFEGLAALGELIARMVLGAKKESGTAGPV